MAKRNRYSNDLRVGNFNLASARDRKRIQSMTVELKLQADALTQKDMRSWRQAWQTAIDVENPRRVGFMTSTVTLKWIFTWAAAWTSAKASSKRKVSNWWTGRASKTIRPRKYWKLPGSKTWSDTYWTPAIGGIPSYSWVISSR